MESRGQSPVGNMEDMGRTGTVVLACVSPRNKLSKTNGGGVEFFDVHCRPFMWAASQYVT